MATIELYTRPSCPFRAGAKRLLRSRAQSWREVDISAEPGRREEMVKRSGRTTVSEIWIDGRHVGGYEDLAAPEGSGELDALLGR
jgi:glutaredoxin 3